MHGVLWGGVGALGIGSADFIARYTTRAYGTARAVFYANFFGALLLLIPVWLGGYVFDAPARAWGLAIFSGVTGAVGLSLLYAALGRGPIAVASPIVAAHPALVVALSVPLGITPAPLQWLGMAVTLGGAVALGALSGRRRLADALAQTENVWPTIWLATASMAFIAARLIAAQEAAVDLGSLQTTIVSRAIPALLAGVAVVWLMACGRGGPAVALSWWPVLVLHGLLETGGSWAVLIGSEGVGRAVAPVVFSCFTAVTVLLARMILKEPVRPVQWAAIGVIIGGISLLAAAGNS